MFRKPRTSSEESSPAALIGRPPTPPTTPAKTPFTLSIPPSVPAPKMATMKAKPNNSVPLPTIGRQGPTGSAKKAAPPTKLRSNGKPNGSILSFFKKSDDATDNGLFVGDGQRSTELVESLGDYETIQSVDDGPFEARFNENSNSVKRRRTSLDAERDTEAGSPPPHVSNGEDLSAETAGSRHGPFFEESDSEQEEEQAQAVLAVEPDPNGAVSAVEMSMQAAIPAESGENIELGAPQAVESAQHSRFDPPPLIKEETSYGGDLNDFKDFDGMDDFDEDLFEEGEEYLERRYMEEQALLEAEDENELEASRFGNNVDPNNQLHIHDQAEIIPACPVCSLALKDVSEDEAARHVNNCLDGNPTPLPERAEQSSSLALVKSEDTLAPAGVKSEGTISVNQFRRPARAPKPGQANPFTLGQSSINGGSAFHKLMSGHAEDAAWAEAAASEHSSRGKPSYQRTCPFYKILPGLFICVDAFRYGAVQGCQAYFLSHFHSDHYVGLTSNWNHGPIYCSKVTSNLVLQQLRVDPQYVVALDWEVPFEVPGTRGVTVTMISANHCPGSSLFLFQKAVGRKPNGEPRLQRILHCGDFRACKMHVQHPLLMPAVQDKVNGKTREQKIDVCYLDTTYLNPRYGFPSQEAVIKACADMCVCLSKDTPDESDGWEQMKRQRAGEGMTRFIRKEPDAPSAPEPQVDESEVGDTMGAEKAPHSDQQILSSSNSKKSRGRLLVVVGTYSIGKERICLGIAEALDAKIYAPPSKQRIVAALQDPALDARMTTDPRAAQVHMTPLFEIRAETLDDYLRDFFPHFTRAVGFRPSGWNYRPPTARLTDSPSVHNVLHSDTWRSTYSMRDLVPQRGSSSRASCFGVPYSEHSSFRELTMFCCALHIDKIIPTVNVGSAKSRDRMKTWCERWAVERKKNGLYRVPEDEKW